jgi:hypothetical protein
VNLNPSLKGALPGFPSRGLGVPLEVAVFPRDCPELPKGCSRNGGEVALIREAAGEDAMVMGSNPAPGAAHVIVWLQ